MDFIYKQGEGLSSITLNQHGINIDTSKNFILTQHRKENNKICAQMIYMSIIYILQQLI